MSRAARAAQIADEAAAFFDEKNVGDATKPRIFIPSTGFNSLTGLANHRLHTQDEEQAFPKVRAGMAPTGSRVLVQIRAPVGSSESGAIIIDAETRKTELDNTVVAKVLACGPMAFRHRQSGQPWPEGAWCQPGDYVRIPKYVGDRFVREYARKQRVHDVATDTIRTDQVADTVVLVLVNDLDVSAKYESAEDAIAERAFL